ncbi:MAG: cytosine permease [Clostridiaceae bacterium]|nr:cytosine permease [Clostridiaceae bacterium]
MADIPEKKKLGTIVEDYALRPVPESERKGWLATFIVWVCYNVVIGDMATGIALGANLDFKSALIALTIGDIFLLIVMSLTGYVGAKTGLGSMPLFRLTTGKFGTYIASLIIAFTSVGWFAVQLGFFGQIWAQFLPLSVSVLAAIGGLLMMTTAIIGFEGLEMISKISVIPLFIFIFGGFIVALGQVGVDTLITYSPQGTQIGSLAVGISTVFGSWAVGSALMPDVSRYAKADFKKILLVWGAALFIGHYILPISGIAFALIKGTWDFGEISLFVGKAALGSGLVGALIISLAQWTTNDNNLYSASLALTNILEKDKWKVSLALGIIGTIAGYSGAVNFFVDFMILLGTVVPPMAALLISDYLLLPKLGFERNYDYNKISYEHIPFIKWSAVIAWGVGIVVAFVTPGVAAVNGIIATLIAHVALTYLEAGRKAKQ